MRSKKNINPVFLASLAVLPIVATTIGCTTKEKEKEKEKDPKTPTPSPNPNILQDKNFEFVENSDGTLKINKYLGKDTNVTIPSEYKGKKVTTIGEYAFCYSFYDELYGKNIETINLPNSIKTIEKYAFWANHSIKKINLNEGLEKIGDSAFKDTKITSITIPSSVKEIGNNAFAGFYSRLKKIICKVPRDKITWKWSDLNATYNWNWTVEYV